MKIKKIIYLLGSLVAISLFIDSLGWTQPRLEKKAPMITHYFAVERGHSGYIWKIYIEAKAGDGDMLKIASVVDETGVGRYPTDWIILKPQYQKYLKGYIQWNTNSGYSLPELTQITLKVSIIDKAGNESNEVVFPFTFEKGVKDPYSYKLPPPFDQGGIPKLGNIHINLFPPGGLGTESRTN